MQKRRVRFGAQIAFILSSTCTAVSGASPPAFIPLGTLPGYGTESKALAISADGLTVVGSSSSTTSAEAFVWTSTGGMIGLGLLPEATWSEGMAVSSDGTVIVGHSGNVSRIEAVRWLRNGPIQGIGHLPGHVYSIAHGVSDDGSIIVGSSGLDQEVQQMAFRWTSPTGMAPLGSLPPNPPHSSKALGVSGNGLVIVGGSDWYADSHRAFRYLNGVMHNIRPGPVNFPTTQAASFNGEFIVGTSQSGVFRWQASSNSWIDLPNMQYGFDISVDGRIIVGRDSLSPVGQVAKIWTETCSTRSLQDLLVQAEVVAVDGWTLRRVHGIAHDNRTIVGTGTDPQGATRGFVAVLPKPGDINFDGTVNVDDLLQMIGSWGPCGTTPCEFSDMNCDGTHNALDLLLLLDNWDLS